MLRAVFVGIDKYSDSAINPLSYARADAEAVGALVSSGIRAAEQQIRIIVDEQATKRNLNVAIGESLAREAKPNDIVLLYFACHGSPETIAGVNDVSRYLITHDTEYENIFATGIDLERELPRWFERIKSRLVLLFLDACFSGRAGGRTFEGPRLKRVRPDFRGPNLISLKRLDLGEGRLMMSACDDNQVARELGQLGHGVFTFYLLESLTSPGSVRATIGVNTLYEAVCERVRLETDGRQIPVLNGRSSGARLPRFIARD